MALLSKDPSMQPEQAEDEHDDDHEANEIDDAVHDGYLIEDNPDMDCARSNCLGKTRVLRKSFLECTKTLRRLFAGGCRCAAPRNRPGALPSKGAIASFDGS
jgi:hypothetical protein